MQIYHRNVAPSVLEALGDRPVVLIHGARQTGKSTLAQTIAQGEHPANYLTLDDAAVLVAARDDPQGFIARLGDPVVLDEVQRAPDLFLAIKLAVDRDRRPGRFLLTGSTNVMLLPDLSESLAGRMEIHTLWPLSQGEIRGLTERFVDAVFDEDFRLPRLQVEERSALLSSICAGGYPEVLGIRSEARRQAWFGSYITTILQRDIRDVANIAGITALPRLLTVIAARAPSLLNLAELGRSVGLPHSTLTRYMALLESTFIVQTLPAWSGNLSRRLVRAPKLMMVDTGLMAYLMGVNQERLAGDPVLLGRLLENFVIMELRKQLSWSKAQPHMLHYRSVAGQEVDLVLEDPSGRVVGVEIKASATIGPGDFRGLRALAQDTGARFHRGVLLYTGTESVPFGARLHALPVSALWRLTAHPAR